MTTLEILIASRDWLAVGPERWCQWQAEAQERGENRRASVYGAIKRIGASPDDERAAIVALLCVVRKRWIFEWEERLPPGRAGWEQVIAAFGKAIEAEKAREGRT